jgi:hypothetical protein
MVGNAFASWDPELKRLIPGVKGIMIGNRVIAITDSLLRDLLARVEKPAKKKRKGKA